MPQPEQLSTPETATVIVEQPSIRLLPQSAPSEGTTVAHGSQAVSTLLPTASELPEPQQLLSEPLEEIRGSTEGGQPAQPQDDFSLESSSSACEYAGQQQEPQAELEDGGVWHSQPDAAADKEQTEQQQRQDQLQSGLEEKRAWISELSGTADEGLAVLSKAAPAVAGLQQPPQAELENGCVWDVEPTVTADEEQTEEQQDQLQSDFNDSCTWIPEMSSAAHEGHAVLSNTAPAEAGQDWQPGTLPDEEEILTGQALCQVPQLQPATLVSRTSDSNSVMLHDFKQAFHAASQHLWHSQTGLNSTLVLPCRRLGGVPRQRSTSAQPQTRLAAVHSCGSAGVPRVLQLAPGSARPKHGGLWLCLLGCWCVAQPPGQPPCRPSTWPASRTSSEL